MFSSFDDIPWDYENLNHSRFCHFNAKDQQKMKMLYLFPDGILMDKKRILNLSPRILEWFLTVGLEVPFKWVNK